MKVIICGAGMVGTNIATYLAEEDNDVTIIDKNAELIARINDRLEVNGIVGFASHPDILQQAGAEDADMIIAATYADEVNMVACQIAHSLFNVPKKIARVRSKTYLDPRWANLFSRDQMPIDVVISPEIEVAKAISKRLRVPGAFNIIALADGKVQLVGVIIRSDCPIINTPLKHLTTLFPDLHIEVVAIIREGQPIIPGSLDEMYPNDEVYFVTETGHLPRSMAAFGHEEPETRRVVIVGAGNIGLSLAEDIQERNARISTRLIEMDHAKAEHASQVLDHAIVLQGDALKREILDEANIGLTEAIIAVTNSDETNILVSLLAKQFGCERAITLINNMAYYNLVTTLGIDAVVSPRAITVSGILQHIRKGRIRSVHSLKDGFAEVLELEALETSSVVNKAVRDISFPDDVIIGAIVRGEQVIIPRPETVIRADDIVIILAAHAEVKKVEQMFAVRLEYF